MAARGYGPAPGLNIGEFNYISCQFAYHHSVDKKQFFKNAFHNLKEGGWFSIINIDVFNMDDWFIYRFFPPAKTIDYQDFPRIDGLEKIAADAGFKILNKKIYNYEEQLALKDIYNRCSKRYSFSQLVAISTSYYDAGMAQIQVMMENNENTLIESNSVILDVVFQKI